MLEFAGVLGTLTRQSDEDIRSTDWLSGILLVGLDEEALFAATSKLVEGLTRSGAWPFGHNVHDHTPGVSKQRYARRGGAMYLEAPRRLTVVSETSSYAQRCQGYVSNCRPERLLDGHRRVIVTEGVCKLPWHVQDAMCKVIDECSDRAMYIVPTTHLSRIRVGLQSRLVLVNVPLTAIPPPSVPPRVEEEGKVLMLTAEQAIKHFLSGKQRKDAMSLSMRAVMVAVLDGMDPGADAERRRVVEALAEADHALAQMESLCGDGIESTAQQEGARRKLALDAAIEQLSCPRRQRRR